MIVLELDDDIVFPNLTKAVRDAIPADEVFLGELCSQLVCTPTKSIIYGCIDKQITETMKVCDVLKTRFMFCLLCLQVE